MAQIGRKIYYDLITGNVLVDTGERQGNVIETTTQQDFDSYTALAERVPATVGCLQLEYGEYASDFAECNGYRVVDGDLEFSYPDPDDTEPQEPVYRKPLSTEVDDLKAADLDNKEAIATLYEMLLLGGVGLE